MCHKLLGEASDDLERVTSHSRKGLHIEPRDSEYRNPVLVPRHWLRNFVLVSETASQKPRSRSETLVGKSCSRSRDTQLHCETGIRVGDTTFARITGTSCGRRFPQAT